MKKIKGLGFVLISLIILSGCTLNNQNHESTINTKKVQQENISTTDTEVETQEHISTSDTESINQKNNSNDVISLIKGQLEDELLKILSDGLPSCHVELNRETKFYILTPKDPGVSRTINKAIEGDIESLNKWNNLIDKYKKVSIYICEQLEDKEYATILFYDDKTKGNTTALTIMNGVVYTNVAENNN